MIFKSLEHNVIERGPATVDLDGGQEEVLRLCVLGKDLGIVIRVDEAQKGVTIATKEGVYRL